MVASVVESSDYWSHLGRPVTLELARDCGPPSRQLNESQRGKTSSLHVNGPQALAAAVYVCGWVVLLATASLLFPCEADFEG